MIRVVGILTGIALLLLVIAEVAKKDWKVSSNILRRTVHLAAGMVNIAASVLATREEIIIVNLAFAGLLILGRRENIFSVIQVTGRTSYGDVFFPFGIAIAAWFLLPNDLVAFQFGVAIMGISDAVAGFVGERWGRHEIKILNISKTIEGSSAFFFSSLLITLILFPVLGPMALLIPLTLTAAELCLTWGLDNLLLPVLAGVLVKMLM